MWSLYETQVDIRNTSTYTYPSTIGTKLVLRNDRKLASEGSRLSRMALDSPSESLMPTLTAVTSQALDDLLAEVCNVLRLTATQYENAKAKYEAVGEWLSAPQSSLAASDPDIYPQGSMALRTTVRPLSYEEYDLDIVVHVTRSADGPQGLYEAVYRRLKGHGEYAKKLERKNRCLRLNYAGDFHLDILPARSDLVRRGTCIEVPDRELACWKASNPLGYRSWFESRCKATTTGLIKARQAPLPPNQSSDLNAVLRLVVQLLKRRRSIAFRQNESSAPRSIVLTTLAGEAYRGETSLTEALTCVLERVASQIADASPSSPW